MRINHVNRQQAINKRKPKRQQNVYKSGDYNAVCDRCGGWYRGSQMSLEWTGLFVCNKCYEPRNIQDFVKSIEEDFVPPIPRSITGLPPPPVCTLSGMSAIVGYSVAGCMIAGYDPTFYLGFNNVPNPSLDV